VYVAAIRLIEVLWICQVFGGNMDRNTPVIILSTRQSKPSTLGFIPRLGQGFFAWEHAEVYGCLLDNVGQWWRKNPQKWPRKYWKISENENDRNKLGKGVILAKDESSIHC